jgi:formate dehydrogenase major subunit
VALTRRELLKRTAAAGSMLPLLGLNEENAEASAQEGLKTDQTKVARTICPYCSVGCGILLHTRNGELVTASGDTEHPINEGTLCSKGASVMNLRQVPDKNGAYAPNPRRVTQVLYRAPGAANWETKSWDWAISRIAAKVKETRDVTFERKDSAGVTVNRTLALAHIGSAALDNEENYALVKLMRSLGVVRVEHHARL